MMVYLSCSCGRKIDEPLDIDVAEFFTHGHLNESGAHVVTATDETGHVLSHSCVAVLKPKERRAKGRL